MMKLTQKLTIAGTAALGALAFAGAALAADLAVKAPMYAPPPPVFSWTGFYVGGHVGAGWGTTESNIDVGQTVYENFGYNGLALTLPLAQTQMNGFLGGVQAGYNWQAGMWVFGIEGDFSGADIKGTSPCLLVLYCSTKVNWTADITGRLGAQVGAGGLVYLKGGAAWINRNVNVNNSIGLSTDYFDAYGALNGSLTDTRLGALIGTGIEYNVPTTNWSVKVEYDYMQFGHQNVDVPVTAAGGISSRYRDPLTGSVTFPVNVNLNDSVHTVKVGANYHFNWGGPVVARY